jgi:hypothetical protein
VSPAPAQRAATRRELLTAGAAAAGALLAVPAAAAAASGGGTATSGGLASGGARSSDGAPGDGGHLTRALSMCVLAAYVYEQVFAEGVLTGTRRQAVSAFEDQERAQVAELRRAVLKVGATVVGPPSSTAVANRYLANRQIPGRLGQLQSPEDALDLLIDVERSSIGSCYVALLSLTGPDAIVLVARIMANDAQHEALVTLQRHALKLAAAAPYALVSGSH